MPAERKRSRQENSPDKPQPVEREIRSTAGNTIHQVLDSEDEFPETAPMRKKYRSCALLAAGLLAFALPVGPVRAQKTETVEYLVNPNLSGARGGNLVASIATDPATFNRLFASGMANALVADQLAADLVHINRSTHELEPALATSWEVARDGRTYTVHLRRGLRFSDGSPFTADDVIFTLGVIADPRIASTLADQLRVDDKFPAIAPINAHTVRITMPRPVGTGLRAFDSIPILSKSRLLKSYQDGTMASIWGPTAAANEIVGLGPFRLKEYRRGIQVVFERNPYYWKKDKSGQVLPYLDTLTLLIIQDQNAEALRFEAGEIDLLGSMSPEHYARLSRAGRESEVTLQDLGPGLRMDFLWFNLNPGKNPAGAPFVDPEKQAVFAQASFRQAISSALDRNGMVRSVLLGLGTPQYGPVSSGNKTWYHPGLRAVPYDPKQAQALLAQSGLKETNRDGTLQFGAGRRPFEFVILTMRGNAMRERTAEIIRQNLAQVGVRVNIQLLLPNELITRILRSFEYEAILFGPTPTDIIPDLQADLWYSGGASHFWHPNQTKPDTPWEADIDALTTKLVQGLDPALRMKTFMQIQEIWAAQMPAIPTMAPNILAGWRHTVGNVRPSILVPYLLWNTAELTKSTR
jgi:peptide/nickel transport system substrate-binding protein